VRIDGRRAVKNLTRFSFLVVERLPQEVHVLSDGLTGSLAEHELVKQHK
jgi:hypothetical protein